jgi:hypothetical protein
MADFMSVSGNTDTYPGSVKIISTDTVEANPECFEDDCLLDGPLTTRTTTEYKAVNVDSDVEIYSITAEEALLARALAEIDIPEDDESDSSDDETASSDSGDATAADLGVTLVSGIRVTYTAPTAAGEAASTPVVATVNAENTVSEVSGSSITAAAEAQVAADQA